MLTPPNKKQTKKKQKKKHKKKTQHIKNDKNNILVGLEEGI